MGARGLVIAVLVLAAIVATPALSAAQDAETTTTTPDPGPISLPAEQQAAAPKDPDEAKDDSSEPAPAVAHQAPPPVVTRSGSDGVARASAAATVSMGDNFYSPASVSIAVGDTVSWKNNGQAPHSATADDGSFDTGVFNRAQSRSHTFTRAGTFTYFCTIHADMHGTVRVLAASSGGGRGGGGSAGSSSAGSSEAAAVAAPDAAGTSTSLAATGLEALGLAAIGLALLAGGIALRRRAGLGYRLPLL